MLKMHPLSFLSSCFSFLANQRVNKNKCFDVHGRQSMDLKSHVFTCHNADFLYNLQLICNSQVYSNTSYLLFYTFDHLDNHFCYNVEYKLCEQDGNQCHVVAACIYCYYLHMKCNMNLGNTLILLDK